MTEIFYDIYVGFFGSGSVVAPEYLLLACACAYGVYRVQRIKGGFWRWLVPAQIYLHRSHRIDLSLLAIGQVLSLVGVFAKVSLTSLIAVWVATALPQPLIAPQSLSPMALGFLLWLPGDFASYWTHRLYHRWSAIWPLHAVHHSAEVLTPFTTYRQHPLSTLLSTALQSAIVGLVQGILVGTLAPDVTIAEIAGVNAFVVLANAAMAALQHSHVWLSYGPILEHLLISPAQHQIHHSRLDAHHGRNFGTTLALWDWLFGTLYVIRGREDLSFGLDGVAEKPLMSQQLWPILADPIRRMMRARK